MDTDPTVGSSWSASTASATAGRRPKLARRSGVRLETIGRIESGKHVTRQEPLLKLDRASSAS